MGTIIDMGEILSLATVVVPVVLASTAWMSRGIVRLDRKIDGLGARLDGKIDDLGARLDGKIDTKIDGLRSEMAARFDRVDARFEVVDARFDKMTARIDRLYEQRSA